MIELRARLAIVVGGALAACGPSPSGIDANGDGGTDGVPQPHELIGILITPTNPIVELDLNMPGSQGFTATGRFRDGVDEDFTGQVTWTVENPAVGTMSGATLGIPAFPAVSVEVSKISAAHAASGMTGQAQITVVAYRRTGSQQDFFFVLPYVDPGGPATKPLDFSTNIPAIDVFFLMDTTGSMIGEINNLRSALTGTVIPGIQAQVANSQFGVGSFEDFPISPYGNVNPSAECGQGGSQPDQPLHVFRTITNNVTAVQNATSNYVVGSQPRGCGDDWPESTVEAMYQVATGDGLSSPSPTNVPPNNTGVGGVDFRSGVMPVVVTITDAIFHAPNEGPGPCGLGTDTGYYGAVAGVAHTRNQAKNRLGNICARAVGVASIDPGIPLTCTGQNDLEDFARATGARVPPQAWDVPSRPPGCAAGQCCTNNNGTGRAPDGDGLCPLVFRTDNNGTGLGNHIVTGIKMLTRFATFDVTSQTQGGTSDVDGNPLPTPHTTADFIKMVMPTGFTLPPPPPNLPNPTFDATTFYNVTPGTEVQFDVRAFNDFVQQTGDAQIFRATIRVLAGGCTPLDERDVLILVPPTDIIVE